jgi:hypothetical protein
MVNRIKKGTWTKIFKWFTEDQVKIPDVNVPSDEKLIISQQNSTYWKDNKVDNIIASQYLDVKDKTTETYVDKIGMETGIYADIQNIDSKILDTYRILWMPDNDIFSRQDISSQEKVAMSTERRNISSNRISQLRKLQQAKQSEIKELAEFEAGKAKAQENAYKEAIAYQKTLLDQQKFGLEEKKFWLSVWKAQTDLELKQKQFGLSQQKFGLDESKFIASEVKDSDLIIWDFWKVDVWWKYWEWNVTQTYGTSSVLASDNVQLASGKVWTPGIDLAGTLWDSISAFEWWKVISITSWQVNIPKDKWEENGWSYWNQIIIEDNKWQLHYYNHLENVQNYKEWQAIQKGQLIGTMWNTGTSTGVHLDYRVKSDRWWEDPRNYMSKKWDKTENINYETVEDYFKDTRTKKFAKVSREQMEKVLFDDVHNKKFKFSYKDKDGHTQISDELTSFIKSWVLNETDIKEYKQLANANKYSSIDINVIIPKLEKVQSRQSMISVLTSLAVNWQLDWELFEWAEEFYIWDGDGYNAIQEYFPDKVDEILKEARSNADTIKEKYKIWVYNIN